MDVTFKISALKTLKNMFLGVLVGFLGGGIVAVRAKLLDLYFIAVLTLAFIVLGVAIAYLIDKEIEEDQNK